MAFPLQQLLHERASVLRYTYIACFALRTAIGGFDWSVYRLLRTL